MFKRIFQNKGFTLVELLLSCVIIAFFFIGTGAVMSSSAKVYITETRNSGARGAIETAGDDIKNYIMSGRNVRLMFYMDGTRDEIVLEGGSIIQVEKVVGGGSPNETFEEGTIFYTDGTYVEPDGTRGAIAVSESDERELAKVAEGIDLGYKQIYITSDGKYIQGLPYAKKFYRDMTMKLEICRQETPEYAFYVTGARSDTERLKEQNVYTIKLTGTGENDIFNITLNTAIMGLNDSKFND